jgi:hypothetical protein
MFKMAASYSVTLSKESDGSLGCDGVAVQVADVPVPLARRRVRHDAHGVQFGRELCRFEINHICRGPV